MRIGNNDIIWACIGIVVSCFERIYCMVDNLRGGVTSCETTFRIYDKIISRPILGNFFRDSGSDDISPWLLNLNLCKALHLKVVL